MHDELIVNVPLLRKVLEHVTAHPEEWNPNTWSGCLAGHTAIMCGHRLAWITDEYGTYAHRTTGGQLICTVAESRLGLAPDQADELFADDIDLARAWELAEQFTDGAIQVHEQFPVVA